MIQAKKEYYDSLEFEVPMQVDPALNYIHKLETMNYEMLKVLLLVYKNTYSYNGEHKLIEKITERATGQSIEEVIERILI